MNCNEKTGRTLSIVRSEPHRGRGRRMALSTAFMVAIAAVLSAAATAPAGATTALHVITQDSTGTTPSVGSPQPEASAKVPVIASALDPVNGDVAELSANSQIFLVVNATHEAATNFGIGTSGTLVKGDVYLVAGKGTSNWPTPISDGTTKATTPPIGQPSAVAFDADGNVVFAGKTTQRTYIETVPATTGPYYGFSSMTAGYLYYIAGFATKSSQLPPAPAIRLPSALTIVTIAAGSGLVHGGTQDLVIGVQGSVDYLNYSDTAQTLYGGSEAAGAITHIAGGGTGTCAKGAQKLTVPDLPVNLPHVYADSSGDLYLANYNGTCTWVMPATNGNLTVDGTLTSVTAGTAYKFAGDGVAPYTTAPTIPSPANATSIGCVSGIAQDPSGNLLLSVNCGLTTRTTLNGVYVVANTKGDDYGITMTAGDVYVLAGNPGHKLGAFTGPMSVGATSSGDVYFVDKTAHILYELTSATTAPTVTKVAPASGPIAGGTAVTITGKHLTGVSAVKFGTTAAATFHRTSSTQVTATTPAHAAGKVTVSVTTTNGVASKANAFTYVAPPTVTKVTPSSGSTAGGTAVTITGKNFTGASAVTFGTTPATTFHFTSATKLTATTPAHAAGKVTVSVTAVGGKGSKADAFTFTAG